MAVEIKDIPFFKGLSDKDIAAVSGCLRERSFKKGENLFLQGSGCERVFIVRSGRVKLYRQGSGGREQILEILGGGDTCACNPGASAWNCSSSAEAVVQSTVWFLSREHYVNLLKTNSNLARSLNRLFAERLKCFSGLIEEVSLKDTRKRLIKFLLDSTKSNPVDKTLSAASTREELAQQIGAARETVTRHLHDLKRKGLIQMKGRQILILDKEGLKKLL